MIFRLCYQIALLLYALLALPKMLIERIFKGKYKGSILRRFGKGFPKIARKGGPIIWVHAVSVGEGRAVAPLINKIKQEIKNAVVILSGTTDAGYRDALESQKDADYVVYMPFDIAWVIGPIVRRVRPDWVILSESDIWFHFLKAAKGVGAKVALVNAKLSIRSFSRFSKVVSLMRPFWETIDVICAQSEIYRERFLRLGIPPSKVVVTGNIKIDAVYSILSDVEKEAWKQKLGIADGSPLLVIGSTHEGEEEVLVAACEQVRVRYPSLKVLLVPRHLERMPKIIQSLKQMGISFDIWDALQEKSAKPYVLFNVMGKLRQCYQLATWALVAGSYTKNVGGHNLLEPLYFGVPSLYGPYVFKQHDMDELVSQFGCGRKVSLEQLPQTLCRLLEDGQAREKMGLAGRELFRQCRGALNRTWNALSITHGAHFLSDKMAGGVVADKCAAQRK